MPMRPPSSQWTLLLLVALAAPLSGQESALAAADPTGELEALRRATERFRDVDVALAEGYVPDPTGMCIMAETEGWPRQLGELPLSPQ